MHYSKARCCYAFVVLAALIALPAAAQLPEGWTSLDIGGPASPGLTAVDASAVWTIRGSGADIYGNADQFQFAYRQFAGSGSISARILSHDGGEPNWAKTGLMFRENETAGARNVNFCMTTTQGGHITFRTTARQGTGDQGGGLFPRTFPLYMRLQRLGSDFSGFWSEDGLLWRQSAPPIRMVMSEYILAGLSATSHEDGNLVSSRFDRVQASPGLVSVNDVRACGADRSVLLSWRPILLAQGYHVYRVTVDGSSYGFTKLTAFPVSTASYTDSLSALPNGVRALYAVTPLLGRVDGSVVEGPAVAAMATPINVPGYLGCSMGEGVFSGAAALDPATGTIAIRGSGQDIWGGTDRGYFMGKPYSGDFQLTAKALDAPTAADNEARSGIMIRESLEPNARNAFLYVSPTRGVGFQYRREINGGTQRYGENVIPRNEMKLPIHLRLILRKQGANGVIGAYTSSDGVTYELQGAVTLRPGPSGTLYAGLAVTAADGRGIAESRFQQLVVEPAAQ
jgi:hypothetical protein